MSKMIMYVALMSLFISCASKHTMMRGSVAMKMDEKKGVACLESNSVKVGDTLDLYNNECTDQTNREGSVSCRMVKAGEAKITRLVNDHYSEFVTTTDIKFAEGSILSKSN